MYEAKAPTITNQLGQHNWKGGASVFSINHLQITSKDFPVNIAIQKAKLLALEMALFQAEAKIRSGGIEKCLENIHVISMRDQ